MVKGMEDLETTTHIEYPGNLGREALKPSFDVVNEVRIPNSTIPQTPANRKPMRNGKGSLEETVTCRGEPPLCAKENLKSRKGSLENVTTTAERGGMSRGAWKPYSHHSCGVSETATVIGGHCREQISRARNLLPQDAYEGGARSLECAMPQGVTMWGPGNHR
jgi:hypothetical protein